MAHPRVELVAGADNHRGRLEAFSRRWNVEHIYDDYREMLRSEKLDIVSVTTASPLHAEMTIAAAEAGVKAVFCEKPMACSLQEADEMIRACDAHGTKLIINHQTRFNPNIQRAKALLEDGLIGELRAMACFFDHWLLHSGSHFFDLLCLFAGEPSAVWGRIDGPDDIDADGSGMVVFASGLCASFSVVPKVSRGYLELFGTKGIITCGHDSRGTVELWQPVEEAGIHYKTGLERVPFPGVPQDVADRGPMQGRFITVDAIDEVIACIEEDRESITSGRDARMALEIAFGVYHSHRSGRSVELPLKERSLWMPESRPWEYPPEASS